jgi:hypothetical protein
LPTSSRRALSWGDQLSYPRVKSARQAPASLQIRIAGRMRSARYLGPAGAHAGGGKDETARKSYSFNQSVDSLKLRVHIQPYG